MLDGDNKIRPTKRQKELLTFIEQFIAAHGYSPSYREIMQGLNYTSVATVALHINNLISRGHLNKRDHSARSLEIVRPTDQPKVASNQVTAAQEKWLVEKVDFFFDRAEHSNPLPTAKLDDKIQTYADGIANKIGPKKRDSVGQYYDNDVAAPKHGVCRSVVPSVPQERPQ